MGRLRSGAPEGCVTALGLKKAIGDARRRAVLTLARAVLRLIDDDAKVQKMQATLLAGETLDGMERFQEYGFTSVPLAGMEAIVVFPTASRAHGVVVAIADRLHRLQPLEPGEVALYTDEGDHILLKRGREIEIVAGTKVRIEAPLVEVAGGDVVADGISLKHHVHGNVAPGSGNTGEPVGP
jgi:phage gp45-like